MNEDPGRERKQPEREPEEIELDDGVLLHDDLDEPEDDMPEFVADEDDEEPLPVPVHLSRVPRPDDESEDEGDAGDNTPPGGFFVPRRAAPPPVEPTAEAEAETKDEDLAAAAGFFIPQHTPTPAEPEAEPEFAEVDDFEEEPAAFEESTVDDDQAFDDGDDDNAPPESRVAPQAMSEPERERVSALYEVPSASQEDAARDEDAAGAEDNTPPAGSPFHPRPRSLPSFQPAARRESSVPTAQVFTVFKPESGSGSMIGIAAVAFCVIVGLGLIFKSFGHDPSLAQFFPLVVGPALLGLGALFAYWTWGSLSLRYVVDRNALTIRWGAQRQIVPLVNIERLIPASADGEPPDIQGVDWPGHHIGKARVASLGEVLFYSGHRNISEVLYVQTDTDTYAISVPDAVAFAEAVQSNQMRGSLFEQRQAVHRDGIAAQSFWIDPQARFLTVLLLGSFVLVLAYVLETYPGLAQSVPLRFPAIGGLLRVTDKSELLDIPRSAAAFMGFNLVLAILLHPWERMVSIVLLLAGIAIQIALLVAAIVAVA